LSESKDEILSLLGIFQKHPDWTIKLECHSAPVGSANYILALTEKRANTIKQALMNLGVKSISMDVKGIGDQKPLVSNDTEQGRLTNTRVEITVQ
ncbi:MAG: OmpA family protein, partial [Ferruginibacter sp.]